MSVRLHETSNPIEIGRGVPISPKLFITVLEPAFKKLDWDTKGINIDIRGRHSLNN